MQFSNIDGAKGQAVSPPRRGWEIVWGILLIAAGLIAILMPVVAALASALVLASLLILGAIGEIVYAIQTRTISGFGWKLVSGIVTLLLGLAILVVPLAGAVSLALLVGAFLFVSGIFRGMLAWRIRPRRGWGWILFDGLLSVALALLIVVVWPGGSLALLGLLTGFSLLSSGFWRIALSGHASPSPVQQT